MDATEPDEQKRLGLKVKHLNKDTWRNKTSVLMHEANFNKFMQNKYLKQEVLATTGTTIAQACPFRGDWSTGYFATELNCQDRHK